MNYAESIKYLYGLERSGIKYSLLNIRRILKILGNPEKKLDSVLIAGTNGKGAVASLLNSVYMEAGYRCGLYTSPHISDFRERIRVGGEMIPRDYAASFTTDMKRHFDRISPSFFEATTAMAFRYFLDSETDIAVIEAGLGGRLDSTNVLTPLVSVITGISVDHTEYLGSTIAEISREKAGIIKKGVPLVAGRLDSVSLEIISGVCREKNSRFVSSAGNVKVAVRRLSRKGISFDALFSGFGINNISCPLVGKYQVRNIRTALAAAGILKERFPVTASAVRRGFRNVRENSAYSYRFQEISRNPLIIADVSHNTEAIQNLKSCLKLYRYRKLCILFAMMKDKDYVSAVRNLEKLRGIMIFTKPAYKRSESPEKFLDIIKKSSLSAAAPDVRDAVRLALCMAGKKDLLLVTGSFFLVNDFLKAFRKLKK